MSDIGSMLRAHREMLAGQHLEREHARAELQEEAKRFRFSWIEGHDTLYKFKTLRGHAGRQVLDIIKNARVYFSVPAQFNDPLDCAPVCRPAKELTAEFIAELQAEEAKMISQSGLSLREVARLRKKFAVPTEKMASAITKRLRDEIREVSLVFCLSARQDHPLLWSHYADSHTGVCLHFRSTPGTLFGGARAMEYEKTRRPVLFPLHYNKDEDDIGALMVRTKAEFWSYESEYRVIAHTQVDWGYKLAGRFCTFDRKLLCGITLGMNVDTIHRRMVMRWVANLCPALPIYQASEDEDSHMMSIARIR
jgi:hypothetical protein